MYTYIHNIYIYRERYVYRYIYNRYIRTQKSTQGDI